MTHAHRPERVNEVRGLVRLVAQATSAVAGTVHGVHRGIADRVFGPDPSASSVRSAHDRIAALAYGSIGTTADIVHGLANVANVLPGARPLSRSPRGSKALAVLNGLFGDRLDADRDLSLPMAVMVDGREIDLDAASLAATFPAASERLVVFVHGLCGSDRDWHKERHDDTGEPVAPYGARLAAALSITPLYLRYNTGVRISVNGQALDALLSSLVDAWPVPVADIAIVGHSMGGLVARSACEQADRDDSPWRDLLRHAVYLASPHQGAPLERFVDRVTPSLSSRPETALIAAILDARSAGIRDLRFGTALSGDTSDPPHPDVPAMPLPSNVYNHMVVATLSAHPTGILARLVGDGLVLVPSAIGPRTTERDTAQFVDVVHVGRTNHDRLLNHPSVYDHIASWFADQDDADE